MFPYVKKFHNKERKKPKTPMFTLLFVRPNPQSSETRWRWRHWNSYLFLMVKPRGKSDHLLLFQLHILGDLRRFNF